MLALPRSYVLADETTAASQEVKEFYPPAVPSDDQYTLCKFYSVSGGLVRALLKAHAHQSPPAATHLGPLHGCEFPFRVSETEWEFVVMEDKAPMIVLGRSGTGACAWVDVRMQGGDAPDQGTEVCPE